MKPPISLENQLLATKFYVPMALGPLIARPRLDALLNESLNRPLMLVSAPAGFGKTTLLSTWVRSRQSSQCLIAWLSLDEEENDPRLFWMSVLAVLERQRPGRFAPLLQALQSSQAPPLKFVLPALINLVLENGQQSVLVLDDYHLITNPEVHTSLSYLVQHIPPQLHLIVATRSDPPLPLPLLRARQRAWEIRTEQLRCTPEETRAFFQDVVGLQLPDNTIQEVRSRTEGWLVGLHLLGLSLPEHVDPLTLLEQASGEHHYILDYLTEVVLHKQPREVQHFLLCTSILERLNASLCDAVMEQTGGQAMLAHLERSNLFVVSLDSRRQWYRYHALFAQTLSHQLQQSHADLMPILHARASRWYARHEQATQAMLHAFAAREWQWAADLLEQAHHSLVSFTWGANSYALVQFQQWVEQLPAEILASRPHFCLACVHLLSMITPYALLFRWLDLAETALGAWLKESMLAQGNLSSQEQKDQIGQVLTLRALLQSYTGEGPATLALSEQAQALLSPDNTPFRALVAIAQSITYQSSSANDAMAAIHSSYQALRFTQETRGPAPVTCCMVASVAIDLIGIGHLHETVQLTQQALLLETPSDSPRLPEEGWIMILQAEVLRERNELAAARDLAREAIALCEQAVSLTALMFLFWGYAILARICLSHGDVDGACTFLQQAEQIGQAVNQPHNAFLRSYFTIVDQVRLWLACGELEQATRWAEELDVRKQSLTPFARERQEVARARVLLAKDQPSAALQGLHPVLQRATTGQRWGHVLEICLLQALAYQMLDKEPQALAALAEAVRLGEPEGYLRSFVEEGEVIAVLLHKLREKQRKVGATPYLDHVLAAFPKPSQMSPNPSKRRVQQTQAQPLLEPVSERELQVLQLMAEGAENQEIAQELVIAVNTVKRHVSHIFAKLGVTNRVQAVKQAHDLGLLSEVS